MSTAELTATETKLAKILAAADAENEANEAREMYDDDGNELAPEGWYWRALEDWLAAYDPRTLPIAERAMRELDRAYREFCLTGRDTPQLGFWAYRDAAQVACRRTPPPPRQRKTPTELNASGVPLRQIAHEWRWYIPGTANTPDIARVERELAEPGSELTPEARRIRHEYDLILEGYMLPPDGEPEPWQPTETRPPAPGLEEMIGQGANIAQIAAIKSDEYQSDLAAWSVVVRMMAELMGVDLPENGQDDINSSGRSISEAQFGKEFVELPLDTVRVMPGAEVSLELPGLPPIDLPEPPTIDRERQVIELFQAGNDVVAIARELRMSTKKVKAAIQRHQQQPEEWTSE